MKSLLRYNGSKLLMEQKYQISEFLPHINHDNVYSELFDGSLVMYFNIAYPIHAFLNDINGDLQDFWRVIKHNKSYHKFLKRLEGVWTAKDNKKWFNESELNNPIVRAVIFYLDNGNNQFITKPKYVEKNLAKWKVKMNQDRLFIDNYSWEDEMEYLTKLYTSNNENRICRVIFYEDPPYYGSENVYKKRRKHTGGEKPKGFDHELLAERNHEAATKGHFILLSYNKCPEIEALYSDWYKLEFEYSPNGKGTRRSTPRTELLLSNEPLVRHNQTKLDTFFQ